MADFSPKCVFCFFFTNIELPGVWRLFLHAHCQQFKPDKLKNTVNDWKKQHRRKLDVCKDKILVRLVRQSTMRLPRSLAHQDCACGDGWWVREAETTGLHTNPLPISRWKDYFAESIENCVHACESTEWGALSTQQISLYIHSLSSRAESILSWDLADPAVSVAKVATRTLRIRQTPASCACAAQTPEVQGRDIGELDSLILSYPRIWGQSRRMRCFTPQQWAALMRTGDGRPDS